MSPLKGLTGLTSTLILNSTDVEQLLREALTARGVAVKAVCITRDGDVEISFGDTSVATTTPDLTYPPSVRPLTARVHENNR